MEKLKEAFGSNPITVMEFDFLPKSVNHQYVKTRHHTFLDPRIREFRKMIKARTGSLKFTGKLVSAILLYYSPKWITKEQRVRRMDLDNKVKAVFDALAHAIDLKDENVWEYHTYKMPSKQEKLVVYLFDMGDLVEYY